MSTVTKAERVLHARHHPKFFTSMTFHLLDHGFYFQQFHLHLSYSLPLSAEIPHLFMHLVYFSIRSFNILTIVILKVLSDSPKTQVIFGFGSVDSFISWQWGVLFFLFLCLIIFKWNVRHAVYRNSRDWNEYYFIPRSRIFFCQVISMRDWGNPVRSWAGFGFCC